MRSESMETCAEGSWVDSTLTSSSGDGGPCPGGCAAPYTSPTPSHTPPDACTHSIPFSTLQSGVWSQLRLVRHPGLEAQVHSNTDLISSNTHLNICNIDPVDSDLALSGPSAILPYGDCLCALQACRKGACGCTHNTLV